MVNDVLRALHHPAARDERIEVQREMFETVRRWSQETPHRHQLNQLLSSESVRHHKNHILSDKAGGGGSRSLPGGGCGHGDGGHGKPAGSLWSQIQTWDREARESVGGVGAAAGPSVGVGVGAGVGANPPPMHGEAAGYYASAMPPQPPPPVSSGYAGGYGQPTPPPPAPQGYAQGYPGQQGYGHQPHGHSHSPHQPPPQGGGYWQGQGQGDAHAHAHAHGHPQHHGCGGHHPQNGGQHPPHGQQPPAWGQYPRY